MANTMRRRGDSLVKKAREYIAGHDAYEARGVLFRVMVKYPERADREVALLMAACAEVDGHVYQAEEWAHIIIEEHPDYYEAWDFLGFLLSDTEDRLDELEVIVRHLLHMRPGDISAKRFIGYAYRSIGRTSDAIEVFRELTDAFPDNAHFWDCMALEQTEAGLYEESLESWRKVLELEPDDPRAIHWISELTRELARTTNQSGMYV